MSDHSYFILTFSCKVFLIAKADVTINDVSVSLGMRRCKNWGSLNLLLKRSNYLKTCSQNTECLIPDFHPEFPSGELKVSSCTGHDLISVDVDGKCQFSVGRAPFCS